MAMEIITLTPSITVDTAAYAAGEVIFTDYVDFGVVGTNAGNTLRLSSIAACEDGGQAPAFSILFFSQTPGQTADANAAVVWGASDDQYFEGMVRVVGGDWYTVGSHSFMSLSDIGLDMRISGSNLYMVAVADAAYDAVAGNDLVLKFRFEVNRA